MRSVVLQTEQEELLITLVEASRNVPRDRRQPFIAVESVGSTLADMIHEGLPERGGQTYMGDVDALAAARLIHFQRRDVGEAVFDVTPRGFTYYEQLKGSRTAPVDMVEDDPVKYLGSHAFESSHPEAFRKWSKAAKLLQRADSPEQFTMVGHLCREAMQAFAFDLAGQYRLKSHRPKSHTVDRIRAVIQERRGQSGKSVAAFLDEMVRYWGTVSDLVQRQEHGAEREGTPLVHEDARRIVFHTCIVMYEIDRSVSRRG